MQGSPAGEGPRFATQSRVYSEAIKSVLSQELIGSASGTSLAADVRDLKAGLGILGRQNKAEAVL